MRTLIVSEFVTLDGVMEAPGGEPNHPYTGWTVPYHSDDLVQHKFDEVRQAETLLIGRITYESFAGAWPGYEGPFADAMNRMSKVVVSSTLTAPQWHNTTVLTGDVAEGVAALKSGSGGPILVHGSKTLVDTLLENELVDVLRLAVFPVTVGSGMRVFPQSKNKTEWTLRETVTFSSQVRNDEYRRA